MCSVNEVDMGVDLVRHPAGSQSYQIAPLADEAADGSSGDLEAGQEGTEAGGPDIKEDGQRGSIVPL